MANKDMNCSLTFHDNQFGVFQPGQIMSGAVTLNIINKVNIRNVTLKFSGRGKTDWYSGVGKNRVHYKGSETYLKTNLCIVGENDEPEFPLEPGTYTYNFEYQVPDELPSSLHHYLFGMIYYTIVVNIDRSLQIDEHFNAGFSIVRPLDLNLESPDIRLPCELVDRKNFCGWCCSAGGFILKAKIPKSGYVPGEIIKVEVFVQNSPTVKVKSIYTALRQKLTFYSDDKSSRMHDFPEFGRFEWKDVHSEKRLMAELVIPQCPATMIGNSNLIQIKYFVIVDGYVTGCHVFPEIMFPITVGTVPFSEEGVQVDPIPTITYTILPETTTHTEEAVTDISIQI